MYKSIIVLFLVFPFFVNAQFTIQGHVVDKKGVALPNATVVLLNAVDTTMQSFNLSNEEGRFELVDITQGDYLLQVTYISFGDYREALVTDWTLENIDIGKVVLEESDKVLQEIEIKAEHIPMGIKGDTISYNASAFKTKPNATVEDLLKKLPGIEVERNGNIKAQGEDVENVLVDGKEFFGGDPTMATKNLQAEAVDKVEVYDKKSEIAEFTGVDDGQEEKTLNLKLKEDHKNGGFGTAAIDIGSEDRYDSKLNYFRFSPSLQTSFIGARNNINQETFSVNDRIQFMGGIGNALASGGLNLSEYRGLQNGLNTSSSIGSNINYDLNAKLKLHAYYLYNEVVNDLDQITNQQQIAEQVNFSELDSTNANRIDKDHEVNTKIRYKINPLTEAIFKNNVHWNRDDAERMSVSKYLRSKLPVGSTTNDFLSRGKTFGFDTQSILKRKFATKGRSLISTLLYKFSDEIFSDELDNFNGLFENTSRINQEQNFSNNKHQSSISLNFTEPLTSKMFLGLQYKFAISHEMPQREYLDILNGESKLNLDLSGDFTKRYDYHQLGINIRKNRKKLKLNFGLQGQHTVLVGSINPENKIEGKFNHLLPSFSLDLDIKGGKSLSLQYNTLINAPDIEQMLPLPNNRNPNYIFIGNPNLIPSYDHKLNFNYNHFDNFSFTSFFNSINLTFAKNRIVNSITISEDLFQSSTPINTDNFLSINVYSTFTKPWRKLKLKYKIRTNLRYANYDSFINGLASGVEERNADIKLSFNNLKTEHFFVETGVVLNWSARKYGIDPNFNQNFSETRLFLDWEAYIGSSWTLGSEFSYVSNSSNVDNDLPSFSLLNAFISKTILNNKFEIKLGAYDLLNQNIGYQRFGGINTLTETFYNALSRYYYLGLKYKIGNGKRDEGIRIDIE